MPASKKRKKAVAKQKAATRTRATTPVTVTLDGRPVYEWPAAPWDVYLQTDDPAEAARLAKTPFPIRQFDVTLLGNLADEARDVNKSIPDAALALAGFVRKGQLRWANQTATFLVEENELEDWAAASQGLDPSARQATWLTP